MKHPAWIAADIIEAVGKTRGQIIDWADEIERGIQAVINEKDARIKELEAAVAHLRARLEYLQLVDANSYWGHKIKAAVEAERETCAQIVESKKMKEPIEVAELIRARSTASSGGEE